MLISILRLRDEPSAGGNVSLHKQVQFRYQLITQIKQRHKLLESKAIILNEYNRTGNSNSGKTRFHSYSFATIMQLGNMDMEIEVQNYGAAPITQLWVMSWL